MFHSDVYFDAPTGGDLLTEIGINPHTVREVVQEDRAMRCPERPCAARDGDTPSQRAWHEAAIIVIPGMSCVNRRRSESWREAGEG